MLFLKHCICVVVLGLINIRTPYLHYDCTNIFARFFRQMGKLH